MYFPAFASVSDPTAVTPRTIFHCHPKALAKLWPSLLKMCSSLSKSNLVLI